MWHKTGKSSDMADGSGQRLDIGEKHIALFRVAGKFYAIDDRCLHRGGPLGDGHLDGNQVTCPWHAWQFDVTTGECSTMPGGKQNVYPVKVESGEVWVEI